MFRIRWMDWCAWWHGNCDFFKDLDDLSFSRIFFFNLVRYDHVLKSISFNHVSTKRNYSDFKFIWTIIWINRKYIFKTVMFSSEYLFLLPAIEICDCKCYERYWCTSGFLEIRVLYCSDIPLDLNFVHSTKPRRKTVYFCTSYKNEKMNAFWNFSQCISQFIVSRIRHPFAIIHSLDYSLLKVELHFVRIKNSSEHFQNWIKKNPPWKKDKYLLVAVSELTL